MTKQPDNQQPYYAKDGMIWKHPVWTHKSDGSSSCTIGFPVCTMHDCVGPDAAETVAALMNAGHNAPGPIVDDKKSSRRPVGPGTHQRPDWLRIDDEA